MVKGHLIPEGEGAKPMPDFKTLQEEAEWWDKQDLSKLMTPDSTVWVERPKKTKTLSVRLDPEDMAELRAAAERQGIGPTTLARMWVREHLHPQQ
jgi:predicted DNA binding CopG/RHH family protein